MAPAPLVVALVYDGLCTFEFGVVVEAFALPRPELGVPWYRFQVSSAESGPIRALGGITVRAPRGLTALRAAHTIVVPGWRNIDAEPPAAITRALRRAFDHGAGVVSICSGVFVLAAAGLLDGQRATTTLAQRRTSRPMIPARRVGMYERSLARHFVANTGATPHQWLVHQRVIAARRHLETTNDSNDRCRSRRPWYRCPQRYHFKNQFPTSPSAIADGFATVAKEQQTLRRDHRDDATAVWPPVLAESWRRLSVLPLVSHAVVVSE